MKISVLSVLLATLSFATSSAHAGWVTTDLGTLGGDYSASIGLNNAGQVAGLSRDASGNLRAFRSSGQAGQMINLGTLGGRDSRATGINAAGQVTGYARTASGGCTLFVATTTAP